MHYSLKGKRVFVAGHCGMVGSAVCRRLEHEDIELVTISRKNLDLRNHEAVASWMQKIRPHVVVLAAAKVGGINANNQYPVDFLQDNLMIQSAVINGAHIANAERLLFLGSSCIYPKMAPQPISENALFTGLLEPTNEPYAIAKIAGLKLVESYRRQYDRDWISAMPTNLYGYGDNYHPENSHVIPGLIRRFHESKKKKLEEISVWGSGKPMREFMHADDLADALVFLIKNYSDLAPINVGTGQEISIQNLALKISEIVEGPTKIIFDKTKPDGTPRKLLDTTKLKSLGWESKIDLTQGLQRVYASYLETQLKD